jgi:hypothetical protein
MKFATLFTLPLLASDAVLDGRQAKGIGRASPGFVDLKDSKYAPRIHKDAKRSVTRYGRKLPRFCWSPTN